MKVQNYEALLSLASRQADLFWAGGPQSDYKRVGGRRWLCAPCRKVPEALEAECGGKRREAIERQARFRRASPGFSPSPSWSTAAGAPRALGRPSVLPLIEAWVETGRRALPRLPSRAGRSPFTACAAEESLGRSHVGSDPGCSAAHPQASLPPPLPTVTQGSCPRHRTN